MTYVVSVKQIRVATRRVQLLLNNVGDGRLAGTGEPGEPHHATALTLDRRASLLVDSDCLPVHVVGASQCEVQQPCRNRVVRVAIDEDEATHVSVDRIRVERHWPIEAQVAHADLVELKGSCRHVFEAVHVDLVLGLGHGCSHGLSAKLEQIRAPRQHRLIAHPHDVTLKLIGCTRRITSRCDDVAAADVDLVGQRDGDRLPRHRLVEVAIGGNDTSHRTLATRWHHPNNVAGSHRATDDGAREPTKVEVRTIHPLHGHSERTLVLHVVDIDGLKMVHQRGARIPRRAVAWLNDVVATQRRQRDTRDVVKCDLSGECAVVGFDLVEDLLRVIDEIELVHCDNDLADAEQ